jgi:hypothetical protein
MMFADEAGLTISVGKSCSLLLAKVRRQRMVFAEKAGLATCVRDSGIPLLVKVTEDDVYKGGWPRYLCWGQR